MTTITMDAVLAAMKELHAAAEVYDRKLFACFEGADYDRGDCVFIGTWLAKHLEVPTTLRDRIRPNPWIQEDAYVVLLKEEKVERHHWITAGCPLPVLNKNLTVKLTGA